MTDRANAVSIRQRRRNSAWSQDQLAEISGLSPRTIQRVERDGRASLETLKALAAAFKIDAAELRGASQVPVDSSIAGSSGLLGEYGPLLAALTDVLQSVHHWRQHFNGEMQFDNKFLRDPNPPLHAPIECQQGIAATVSIQLHGDTREGVRALEELNSLVRGTGSYLRSSPRYIPEDMQSATRRAANRLIDHIEFYLGRARKELTDRCYPEGA